jgi:hypothetical protein
VAGHAVDASLSPGTVRVPASTRVHRAGQIVDHEGREPLRGRVDGAGLDAVVPGEAENEHPGQAAVPEPAGEPGAGARPGRAGLLAEGAVGVDVAARSFSQDEVERPIRDLDRQRGPGRAGDAVVGPENLRVPVDRYRFERSAPWV